MNPHQLKQHLPNRHIQTGTIDQAALLVHTSIHGAGTTSALRANSGAGNMHMFAACGHGLQVVRYLGEEEHLRVVVEPAVYHKFVVSRPDLLPYVFTYAPEEEARCGAVVAYLSVHHAQAHAC